MSSVLELLNFPVAFLLISLGLMILFETKMIFLFGFSSRLQPWFEEYEAAAESVPLITAHVP